MKLKLDDAGHVVLSDGKPVYIHDDGKEVAFDAAGTVASIGRLNAEAKGHRERAEAAEAKLKPFEGIEDADAARKALETVANIKDGDLISAGKAEEIKAGAKKAAEEAVASAQKAHAEQLSAITGERDTYRDQLYAEKVGGAFARSKFVAEKVAVPPPMLEKSFGSNFKVEDGKLVPYDAAGNKLFSRIRPTELAEFDEAIEILIAADPYKDHILVGQVGGGGGAGNGGGGSGKKEIRRADYDKLAPAEQATWGRDAGAGKAVILD